MHVTLARNLTMACIDFYCMCLALFPTVSQRALMLYRVRNAKAIGINVDFNIRLNIQCVSSCTCAVTEKVWESESTTDESDTDAKSHDTGGGAKTDVVKGKPEQCSPSKGTKQALLRNFFK